MSDNGSLDAHTVSIFQHEIHRQAEFAMMAILDADYILRGSRDSVRFWFSIDGAVSAIAKLSDVLWPAQDRKGSKARAAQLRELFGLGETSILEDKLTRNGFEHFAERIDEWSRTSISSSFIDTFIGPRSSVSGVADDDFARIYDPESGVVSVFGSELDLRAALRELGRVTAAVPRGPH